MQYEISFKVERYVTVAIDADDADDAGDVAHTMELHKPISYDDISTLLMGRDSHIVDSDTEFRITFVAPQSH
jgi:hypothetical protein